MALDSFAITPFWIAPEEGHVLQQTLGERRVVGEIGERDLELDRPEVGPPARPA